MKNKLSDLNNHLFAQLERLSDERLSGDKLKEEIARSRAVTEIAAAVTANSRVTLEAAQLAVDYPTLHKHLPMLGNDAP